MDGLITVDYLKNCAQRLRAFAATEPNPERAALINEIADTIASQAEAMERSQTSANEL
jgi:hypothetical protein